MPRPFFFAKLQLEKRCSEVPGLRRWGGETGVERAATLHYRLGFFLEGCLFVR